MEEAQDGLIRPILKKFSTASRAIAVVGPLCTRKPFHADSLDNAVTGPV